MEEKQLSRKEKEEIRKQKGNISKEEEKKLRKRTKIIYIILLLIAVVVAITSITDYTRFKKNKKPIFAIKTADYKDGGTKEYIGLGYKIIDFNKINGYKEMKFGSWSMKYEDFDNESDKYNQRKEVDVVKLMILENLEIITAKEKEIPSNPNKFIELQKDLYNQIKEKENSYEKCLELLIHSESATKFGKYVLAKIIDDKNDKIKFKFKNATEFITKYEEYLKKLDIKELEDNDLDKIAYDIIFGNPEVR